MTIEMRSALDLLVRKTRPDGEKTFSISSDDAPLPAERDAFLRRSARLSEAMRVRDPDRCRLKIAVLVGILPSPLTDTDDAEAAVAVYQAALADLPPWAVEAACEGALRGKVGTTNGRFRPTPGELHHAAECHVGLIAKERAEIERVLNVRLEKPRLSTEERRAIIARVGRLTSDAVKACEAFPPAPVAADHRDIKASEPTVRAAAESRLREMAREVGNEWRG